MDKTPSPGNDIHSEAFLRHLMRNQLRLSASCAVTFMVVLLGLPMANYLWPQAMGTRVWGFTLTWFILGVLFFPFVWAISYFFIKRSLLLEQQESAVMSRKQTGNGGAGN